MGIVFKRYLDSLYVYECVECGVHLTSASWILSKGFNGIFGKAYLFSDVVNVYEGAGEIRDLLTGRHVVCDVFCISCDLLLGWKYLDAFVDDQRYKIGHFVLEKTLIRFSMQSFPSQIRDSGSEQCDQAVHGHEISTFYRGTVDL